MIPIDRTHPPSRLVFDDGERVLVLRPYTLADVDPLLEAILSSLDELKRFMPWAHGPHTRQGYYENVSRFAASYHAGTDYPLGMFSAGGRLLGGVGLHARVPLNTKGLEVGYWCRSDACGKGWTTLGTQMAMVLAFDYFGCDRLQVGHDEANVQSRRVVEKCGFPLEGISRNLLTAVTPEVRAGGYLGTRRNREYALIPEDLPSLPWLAHVREKLVIYDALGERLGAP